MILDHHLQLYLLSILYEVVVDFGHNLGRFLAQNKSLKNMCAHRISDDSFIVLHLFTKQIFSTKTFFHVFTQKNFTKNIFSQKTFFTKIIFFTKTFFLQKSRNDSIGQNSPFSTAGSIRDLVCARGLVLRGQAAAGRRAKMGGLRRWLALLTFGN